MKKVFVLLLIPLPFLAQAQLEVYGRYTAHGTVEPNINYNVSKKITQKIALTFFSLVEQNWGEALIGASYSPSTSFTIGASAGIEHGTSNLRYSVSAWKKNGKTSLLVLGELGSGPSNYLYKANLFHQYSNYFTLGVTAWRFHGTGPNLRLTIPKLSATIWSMPAYDFEAHASKMMIGISINI